MIPVFAAPLAADLRLLVLRNSDKLGNDLVYTMLLRDKVLVHLSHFRQIILLGISERPHRDFRH